MITSHGRIAGVWLLALVATVAPGSRAAAQGGADRASQKFEATLTAPDGATNTRASGKAKAFRNEDDTGEHVSQRLQITAQRLERRTDYRVVVDGVDFGVYSPRGNGALALRFRDPVRGHLLAFPEGLVVDVTTFVQIDIVNNTTGEVALTGTFAASSE
jgi:hypothetical protein